MKVIRFLAAALCFAAIPSQALEIKGISVNEKADCERIRQLELRPGTFAKSCESLVPMWMHQVAFLRGEATLGVKQQGDGVVTAVLVSHFDFDEALEAFTLKYGKPKLSVSTIQNRMGAKFEQVSAVWEDETSILMLKRHGAKIDEPSLGLMSKKAIDGNAQERVKSAGNI